MPWRRYEQLCAGGPADQGEAGRAPHGCARQIELDVLIGDLDIDHDRRRTQEADPVRSDADGRLVTAVRLVWTAVSVRRGPLSPPIAQSFAQAIPGVPIVVLIHDTVRNS